MRNMSLKDIQDVSLDIAKDIHKFCVEHNITYSLDGGSMLGAVRHNGFIPWDDDMDIIMPRPDFNLFIKEYKSERGYKVLSAERGTAYTAYARVCETRKTFVKQRNPWSPEETGVFIDIFPADGTYDDKDKAFEHAAKIRNAMRQVSMWRRSKKALTFKINKQTMKIIMYKMLFFLCLRNPLTKQLKLMNTVKYKTTKRWLQSAYIPDNKYNIRYQRIELWDNLILHVFEDTKFFIFKEYDEYLNLLYGEYMTLPPLDKRRGCESFDSCYWK